MGRKPMHSADEKLRVVLLVLKGEVTQVEIARRMELSQTTISKWLKQFTEGGRKPWPEETTAGARQPSAKTSCEPKSRS